MPEAVDALLAMLDSATRREGATSIYGTESLSSLRDAWAKQRETLELIPA